MDTAGADHLGIDAVVCPGLLSDISVNDGGGNSKLRSPRDTPGAANGIPTVVFPVGYNNHGQPIGIQLLGRAWDDDTHVGMAYAFAEVANAADRGHVEAQSPSVTRSGVGQDQRPAHFAVDKGNDLRGVNSFLSTIASTASLVPTLA